MEAGEGLFTFTYDIGDHLVLLRFRFQDLEGNKSGTVAGSTPGICLLGRGGTGVRLQRSFHLAHELWSKIPGAGSSSVALKSSSLKYFRRISISSSEAYDMA